MDELPDELLANVLARVPLGKAKVGMQVVSRCGLRDNCQMLMSTSSLKGIHMLLLKPEHGFVVAMKPFCR